jgi:hypothetical protein
MQCNIQLYNVVSFVTIWLYFVILFIDFWNKWWRAISYRTAKNSSEKYMYSKFEYTFQILI